MRWLGCVALVLSLTVFGCGDSDDGGVGGKGQDCYPNGTCDAGFMCVNGVCAPEDAPDASNGADVVDDSAGKQVVENCSGVSCPPGTTVYLPSNSEELCSGGGSVEVPTQTGSVTGQCFGSGACAIICYPPAPCCGLEEWTDTSYKCDLPCAGACSCGGKCGTVSGPGCEADCGGCAGGEICSDNTCVDECPGGTATCAGSCCDTTEICYLNECCDLAANCVGKMCGSDGCGGVCEAQESIPGCALGETCSEGQCVASCEGMLPTCSVVAGEEVVMVCDDSGEEVTWVPAENCAFDATFSFCMNTALGATCVECLEPSDCAPGEACDAGGECIEVE